MPYLEIPAVVGDQGARTAELTGVTVTVGRADGNDIVIIDGTLSRRHCEFFVFDDGSWGVRDLGSGNGVVVRGERIGGDYDLEDGDQVKLGNVVLTYRAGAGDDDEALELGDAEMLEMGDPAASLDFDEIEFGD
ncbi:MAG: FHA domain-containing protein [Planctomycetota bacterium]|jgi:pSer/pThr/pTyr-binding forkhead associated (FHA) protein